MKSPQTATSRSFVRQELHRDARVFIFVALTIAVMLTISTCHYHRSLDSNIGLTVTPLDLSKAEEMDTFKNLPSPELRKHSIAANGYYLTGVIYRTGRTNESDPLSISVFGRRSSDKGLAWATQITVDDFTPAISAEAYASSSSEQSAASTGPIRQAPWTASPNGEYVAFRLNGFSKTLTYVAVVDTSTGEVVQTTHVTRRVIGMELTDTHLAVETADQLFPGGAGNATLTVLSLSQHDSPPTALPTTQWLIGASHRSFLMSDSLQSNTCTGESCIPRKVSCIDGRGRTISTVDGIIHIHSGGWMLQYSDPTTASSLFSQIYDSASQQERDAARDQLAGIRLEIMDPDSGRRTDVTGLHVSEVGLPTGAGLLALKQVPSDDANAKYAPVFWLSATDDGHPHTENLEQFKNN